MSMLLTPEELEEITGKKRRGAQKNVLHALGVKYKERPDGTLAVLKSHAEHVLGGRPAAERTIEPNWGALAPTAQ